ncbi:pro-sigmaK processing inhibitor BofA family protein [Alicyclobacillus mengziensis]|uniref:Pro-sigmaK processing inhibitor BofA family protein n=1 Tax=Alicyclobacillus mengziensis TaxID=2931921 RepID=A0A9X7VZG8_9BACL|nr:pro-sigmaK processing inhibitor BofA family protein [Alicyclobacillus mengziensis]QSO47906.1 pro-sigmaK processing inhibitor BofA family protein [Alicyclobacillus mengziensis]
MTQSHLLLYVGLAAIAGVTLVQVFRHPGLVFWKLAKSAAIGCLFVFAVNWIGQYFHYHLPFNAFTALTAGFLGLPGVGMLVALNVWLYHT